MSVPFEELQRTLQQRQEVADTQPTQDPVTLQQLQQAAGSVARQADSAGPVMEPIPQPGSPSITQRIGQRFMGTDVSDPREMQRLSGVMAGSIGGGLIGARTPVAPGAAGLIANPVTGAAAGSLLGTAAGAVAPEAVIGALEAAGIAPPGTRRGTTLSNEELANVLAGELLLDLAATGAVSSLRMAGRAGVRAVTGLTPEARRTAETSAELGVDLMPVQAGRGRIGRGFVAVLGRFPLVGRPFVRRAEAADAALVKMLDEVPERVLNRRTGDMLEVLSRSEIGEAIYRDARETIRVTGEAFSRRYDELYDAAAQANVRVMPRHTLQAANDILQQLRSQAPRQLIDGVPQAEIRSVEKVVADFIESEISAFRGTTSVTQARSPTSLSGEGLPTAIDVPAVALQSLRQMDTLIGRLDQTLAQVEPGAKRFAESLFHKLRNAMKTDVLTNARGEGAEQIVNGLKALDTEFGQFMEQLVKSSAAKKLGSVQRRGLRAMRFEASTIPVDKLADSMLSSQSPQMMRELKALVQPETFQRLAASALNTAIEGAVRASPDGAMRFSAEAFERAMGFNRTGSMRGTFMRELLSESSGFSPRDLDSLAATMRAVGSLEIPNASTFIARRAVLGGVTAMAGAFAIGTRAGQGGAKAGLFGALMFLGGTRLIARALANPETARAFSQVLRPEADRIVRRTAALSGLRLALNAMEPDELEAPPNALFELGRQYILGQERAAFDLPDTPDQADLQRAAETATTSSRADAGLRGRTVP